MKHLQRAQDHLKKEILTIGAYVEDVIDKAILALVHRRPSLSKDIMECDDRIDQLEVEVEEECMKILALHQPVAADLRYIVAVLKVNNDLERMGDLAVNIAHRAYYLGTHEPLDIPDKFNAMANQVRDMVHDTLDALINQDTLLARRVLRQDSLVDRAHRKMFTVLQDLMKRDTSTIVRAVHTLSASRNLERIADLATNIAEDVIFMVEGEVVRHRRHNDLYMSGEDKSDSDSGPVSRSA